MHTRAKKITAIVVLASLLAGFIAGEYIMYTFMSDDQSEDDTDGTDATIECEACQDTKSVLIIVTEDGVPTVREYPCPYCGVTP